MLENGIAEPKHAQEHKTTRVIEREERKEKRMLMKMEDRLDDHATRSMDAPRGVWKPPLEETMVLQDKTRVEAQKLSKCSLQF